MWEKLGIGNDHAAVSLKNEIMEYLTNNLSESFRLPGDTGDGNAGKDE